ncbi:hypothetical protein [Micromonospora kangleipakensis]|nr:hypothetical protein [Micromonospora kangleipakensis]
MSASLAYLRLRQILQMLAQLAWDGGAQGRRAVDPAEDGATGICALR